MINEPIVEYRAVWPNGNLVDACPPSEDKVSFFQNFDTYTATLKTEGVPKEYLPRVEGRLIDRTVNTWKSYGEIEHDLKLRQEEARRPRHVVSPGVDTQTNGQIQTTWGEPTPQQIERVRRRQFGWHDPCVICGTRFIDCPHDGNVTEAFVTMVKRRYL